MEEAANKVDLSLWMLDENELMISSNSDQLHKNAYRNNSSLTVSQKKEIIDVIKQHKSKSSPGHNDSLYKTGEKYNFTHHRPISLLPQFSKILEKPFNHGSNDSTDK